MLKLALAIIGLDGCRIDIEGNCLNVHFAGNTAKPAGIRPKIPGDMRLTWLWVASDSPPMPANYP